MIVNKSTIIGDSDYYWVIVNNTTISGDNSQ